MQESSHWHFSRPDLAQAYLTSFRLGLSSARGLFARRRMGKTEFLVQDFIPAAEIEDYTCAYVNLWELKDDPATALVSALYKAIEPKGISKIWARLNTPIKKLKTTGKFSGAAEAAIEAEFTSEAKITGTLLMDVMAVFDASNKKIIFIIDEAQVLASPENSVFAHALRAALDTRKDRIKVLFAGSSETTLRRMFGRTSEPFYNWATLEPFPLLGRSFVESMVEKVGKISKYPLLVTDAIVAFDELKQTPLFFREYLDRYLTHPYEGAQKALEFTKTKVFNDSGFGKQWKEFLPADQMLLELISNGASDLHGTETRKQVGSRLGLDKPVTTSVLQNALRRLIDKSIVARVDRGTYRIEDEVFSEWVKHHDE